MKPKFELTRVYADASNDEPAQIVPVTGILDNSVRMNRRGFLGAGLTAAAALTALDSCSILSSAINNSGKTCTNVYAHNGKVTSLAVSPDGKWFASGSEDKTVKLWSLPGGALVNTLTGHKDAVKSLALSPDGTLLVSGSADKTIKLWNVLDGKLIKTIEEHTGAVYSLTVSPDGTLLVSGGYGKNIKLWHLPGGEPLTTEEEYYVPPITETRPVPSAISPDGKLLVSGGDGSIINLWRLPEGKLVKMLETPHEHVASLVIRYEWLVAGGGTFVTLWSLPEGKQVEVLRHSGDINTLALSPDGMLMALSNSHSNIELKRLPSVELIRTLNQQQVYSLAISPDSRWLISGGNETINIWSLPDGKLSACLMDLKCSPSTVKGITYTGVNEYGQSITYTLPCGSPIPPGATCTCNCVPGSVCSCVSVPSRPSRSSGGGYCRCNKVCTCVPVYR
jgi:WD40 repeat protein